MSILDELRRLLEWLTLATPPEESGTLLWQTVLDNPDMYGAADLDAPYEWEDDIDTGWPEE